MKRTAVFLYVLFISCFVSVSAQVLVQDPKLEYNADSVRAVLDKAPYFTLFKDNYFIGGTTIGHKPTAANSDVKFQLSIAQRLTKSKLPFDTLSFYPVHPESLLECFPEISAHARPELQPGNRTGASDYPS